MTRTLMRRLGIGMLLALLAGCEPISSLAHKRTDDQEQAAATTPVVTPVSATEGRLPDMPFQELIPLIRSEQQQNNPAVRAQTWYGTWVRDQGNTWTSLRIERPLLRIIGIDKQTNTSRVMDGHYAVAHNGMMYGVMTGIDTVAADPQRVQALLDGDEYVLRKHHGDKKLLPFSCRISVTGPELSLVDFQGVEKEREQLLPGRYRQISVGRPSVAVPGAPLGIRINDTGKLRVTLVLQPGRIEFRLTDRSGRRLNVAGNYDVAAGGIIFGVLTSVEHGEVGKPMTRGHIEPQVFCFRFAFHGNIMIIDEVHSLRLARNTEKALLGEYHFPAK